MKQFKFSLGICAVIVGLLAIFYVLQHEKTLITHPKGTIALSQLWVITTNYILMLIVVIPTFIALFMIAWKYRAKDPKANLAKEHPPSLLKQMSIWLIPLPIIAVMIFLTWKTTHELDPYKPIKSDVKPLTIQVVALDWKWLFIYPEQGIAAINLIHFPERTPINFRLTADRSPMNSFWLPQLSGQIYAMTGMVTPLHIMADGSGEYVGRAAEINGKGYAGMTFLAKSTSQEEFEKWVAEMKRSPLRLSEKIYTELSHPSIDHPVTLYSHVEEDLFNTIVMKYMQHPTKI